MNQIMFLSKLQKQNVKVCHKMKNWRSKIAFKDTIFVWNQIKFEQIQSKFASTIEWMVRILYFYEPNQVFEQIKYKMTKFASYWRVAEWKKGF